MNVYDSEKVSALLIDAGWNMTSIPEEADLVIINSCSVRDKPLQKLFSYAGRFIPQKRTKGTAIFIMGCVAQQLGKEIIDKASFVDGVFGPGSEHLIPDIADKKAFPFVSTDKDLLERQEMFPEKAASAIFSKISSSVTIMHGCDNYCSYCIVPFVRGKEVSRESEKILGEIKTLAAQGIKEITLLGQNVNSYYDEKKKLDFTGLLHLISAESGIARLRFVTSHPKDFNEQMARAFSEIDILMPYLHLPAQSGSDNILSLMNRKYTLAQYLEKIELARKYCPDISLSSDFIVGFPGETQEDFEQTLNLLEKAEYDTIFAFNYSPRPFTKAFHLKETLSDDEKMARLNILLDKQKKILKTIRGRFLGRTLKVLIEGKSGKGDTYMGRSEHNLIVHVRNSTAADVSTIINVSITEILENTLRGDKQ